MVVIYAWGGGISNSKVEGLHCGMRRVKGTAAGSQNRANRAGALHLLTVGPFMVSERLVSIWVSYCVQCSAPEFCVAGCVLLAKQA